MALTKEGTEKISLEDAFSRAHEIIRLSGESPAQDLTVTRLMLAILYCTYARKGTEYEDVEDIDDAIDMWESLYAPGRFDSERINGYLEEYRDRFYLFDPIHPFYQSHVEDLGGTEYSSAKLIGNLSQSNNKDRLFSHMCEGHDIALSYDEAARWVLYLHSFDDVSLKPSKSMRGKKHASINTGWLGRIGPIYVKGKTLFDTLMLNFVLADRDGEPFSTDGKPVWELEPCTEERRTIMPPSDPITMLTIQTRRFILKRENGAVVGYQAVGGDVFSSDNMFIEQMTVWRGGKDGNYHPKRLNPARTLWRDFSAIMSTTKDTKEPGVQIWAMALKEREMFPYDQATFLTTGIKYGTNDYMAESQVSDGLSFDSRLISEGYRQWDIRVMEEIEKTEVCIGALKTFVSDLLVSVGYDKTQDKSVFSNQKAYAESQAYFLLDNRFRNWLLSLDPDADDIDDYVEEWRSILKHILIEEVGKPILLGFGEAAFKGKDKQKNSFAAFRKFKATIYKKLR